MSQNIFMSILRNFLRKPAQLEQLVILNIVVFILLKLFYTGLFLFRMDTVSYENVIRNLAVPAQAAKLLHTPWTLITYMFIHESFMHILFNMLWLYWMGKIFSEHLGSGRVLGVYLFGGISGAVLYITAYNIFPAFRDVIPYSYTIGASAGILAIVVATATLLPNFRINLLFIGPVALKYFAGFTLLLDLLSIGEGNAGGHIAHLGGALFGYIYIIFFRRGTDITGWFGSFLARINIFHPSSGYMKIVHRKNETDEEYLGRKKSREETIDAILDKISQSGYDSLTRKEKEILFKASRED